MNIEEYKPVHFERIEKIYNASKKDEFLGEVKHFEVLPLQEDESMMELFRRSTIFVYKIDKVVGFAGYTDKTISWLFVDPAYRGRKVGQALVKHILFMLGGRASLNVTSSNLAAKSLYMKLGFSVSQRFDGQYNGNIVVVARMEFNRGHG